MAAVKWALLGESYSPNNAREHMFSTVRETDQSFVVDARSSGFVWLLQDIEGLFTASSSIWS